jgi:hypothetical protein
MQDNTTAHTANKSMDALGEVWQTSYKLRIVAFAVT